MICPVLSKRDNLRAVAEAIYLPGLARGTRYRVEAELKRWERITGNPPIASISKPLLRSFRTQLVNEGYSADTVITNLVTLNTILKEACEEWDLLEAVPRIGKGRISRTVPDPEPATVAQIEGAFRNADSATWPRLSVSPGTFWRAWLATVGWTGLRLSDSTLNLRWKHLRPDERCILIVAGKTRRNRKRHVYPLPDWLMHWIEPMKQCGSERIFPVPNTMTRFRDHMRKLCMAADVDDFLPQNVRQFAVSQWTRADRTAGEMVHGMGLPKVMTHYLAVLGTLESAEPDVKMPECFGE